MFWLSAWGNLHDPFVAGVNISGEGCKGCWEKWGRRLVILLEFMWEAREGSANHQKTRFKHRKGRGKIIVQQARMAGMRRLLLLLSFPPCTTPLPGRVSASSISMLKEIGFSKPLMQRRVWLDFLWQETDFQNRLKQLFKKPHKLCLVIVLQQAWHIYPSLQQRLLG